MSCYLLSRATHGRSRLRANWHRNRISDCNSDRGRDGNVVGDRALRTCSPRLADAGFATLDFVINRGAFLEFLLVYFREAQFA